MGREGREREGRGEEEREGEEKKMTDQEIALHFKVLVYFLLLSLVNTGNLCHLK